MRHGCLAGCAVVTGGLALGRQLPGRWWHRSDSMTDRWSLGSGGVIPGETGRESCWCHGKEQHQRDAFKVRSEEGAEPGVGVGGVGQEVRGAEAQSGRAGRCVQIPDPIMRNPAGLRAGPVGGDGRSLLGPHQASWPETERKSPVT